MSIESGLRQKLLAVFRGVHRFVKTGTNEAQKYQYVEAAVVLARVRELLAENGVFVTVETVVVQHQPYESRTGANQWLSTVQLKVTFVDAETGDELPLSFLGTGADSGDKGLYKAITGALKYFFLANTLAPTGDDPEVPREDEFPRESHAPVRVASKAQVNKLQARFQEVGLDGRQKALLIYLALGVGKKPGEVTSDDVSKILAALENPDLVAQAKDVVSEPPPASASGTGEDQ